MNPIRQILNKQRWSCGDYDLKIVVDVHAANPITISSSDIDEINPNGFTTGSDFEIPYHRVKEIYEITILPHERDTIESHKLIYEKN